MKALIPLYRESFVTMGRMFLGVRPLWMLQVSMRRTESGVEMVRLSNHEGWVDVLPFMGAVVWDACFFGVRLGASEELEEPRLTTDGVGVCGRPLYHAWELHNVPESGVDHPLHDETPCTPMDQAQIELGEDEDGPEVTLVCSRCDRSSGIDDAVAATVALRPGATEFEAGMDVRNLGKEAMNLTCMARTNFTFLAGAHILQPAPWDPAYVRVHTALPGHLHAPPELQASIDGLTKDPRRLAVLDPALCDPALSFSLSNFRTDPDGWAHLAIQQDRGDGFRLCPAEWCRSCG
jgi:hypothetical protein